jgi:hypothetical protein
MRSYFSDTWLDFESVENNNVENELYLAGDPRPTFRNEP